VEGLSNRAAIGWFCAVLGAVFAEWRALNQGRHSATLSAATRVTFRTDTAAGRFAFVAMWTALTSWFLPHILKGDGREQ
jgi:hypothetical protein